MIINNTPQTNSPQDLRSVVSSYAQLISADYWKNIAGADVSYLGMIVSVTEDTDEALNGVYTLKALPVSIKDNWVKVGEGSSVDLSNYYTKTETYSQTEINNLIKDTLTYTELDSWTD